LKKIILLIFVLFSSSLYSQDEKTVTLVVSGQGKTQEEAKLNALRSAIEQSFGAFISSKTEILNDNLVKDEIVSVANGNIQKFEIISMAQIPSGFATSLKAIVSITKLTSFVESKGVVVDIKGGEFSFNVKKEEFYGNSELSAILNFLSTRINSEIFYDYNLLNHPPKVEKEGYSIELEIGIKAYKNFFIFFSDFFKLLENISLSGSTVNFRKESNLPLFSVEIKNQKVYYLRNPKSYRYIQYLDHYLYLKAGDFEIKSNPQTILPSADMLIKSAIIANNFIIFNRKKSPNAGVYWNWLPYEYSKDFKEMDDGLSPYHIDKNRLTLTTEYMKTIPKQLNLNSYSDHMSPIVNNGRTDYNIVLKKLLLFSRSDFEKLNSITIEPKLNNYHYAKNQSNHP
jgi:hypothetical protein